MDGETNLFTVKEAFNETWQGRSYVRGQGYKQFLRWYWFMEQRSWPSGDRPDPAVFLQAMEEVKVMRASRSGARDNSIWEPLGPTTWTSISYNPGNGRVNTIAIDPMDSTVIYVGTPSGGLWRSTDDGSSWEPLFTDLPSMGVSAIAMHPTSPDTIYIATGDGDGSDTYSAGVLKTTDGGQTWETTGLNWNITASRTTSGLRMHPYDPDVMLCASSNGLYRTVDGADNWTLLISGSFKDVEFMPGDTTVVYACTDRFYRSVNGVNFSTSGVTGLPTVSEVGRMAIAVSPADPMVVYVLCSNEENNSFLGLYHSYDGGVTFELRSDWPNLFDYSTDGSEGGGQAWYDMALAVDPEDPDIVYIGGINVWKSEDGGYNWDIRSHWIHPSDVGYTHADIHFLEVFNGQVLCGSDGGIYTSDDQAITWEDRSAGLDITQFYRLGGSELVPDMVLAGAQDNGSNRYVNAEWMHIYGADGMEAAVDIANPDILYASYQRGGLLRSDDGGFNFINIAEFIFEDGAWVTPFVLDPLQPTHILAGFNNVWLSVDRGEYWEPLTYWNENEFVRCLAYAPTNSEVIYVARNDMVQRTLDGGLTWENIRPGLPSLSPTSIAVDHLDPLHVWITFSGTNANQKVYESTNGGSSWINKSAGLPNIPVNSIVTQPHSLHAVYVGTDMAVFFRDDLESGWQLFGDGLPNVVVSELEINMATHKLRAATFGRGIWEADLFLSPFVGVPQLATNAGPLLVALDNDGSFGLSWDVHEPASILVLDAMGRTIDRRSMACGTEMLDLRAFAKGTYNITITTSNGRWVRRVVR